jgi:uncharacterized protein YjcR
MATAKSDERIRAEQMYRESDGTTKLVEIALLLGVSPSKVRKWKSLDNWDHNVKSVQKKQMVRSTNKKGNAPSQKKRGAPSGNKNAIGNNGGAPLRNKNSEKHGIYAQVYWDFLEEDEYAIVEDSQQADEEKLLIDNISLLFIRERRLMKKVKQFHEQDEKARGLMVAEIGRHETKREFDSEEDKELYNERQRQKINEDKLLPGHQYTINTRTVDNTELLLKAHAELTRVQEQKRRCAEALHRLRQARTETKANTVANDWIIALTGGDSDD